MTDSESSLGRWIERVSAGDWVLYAKYLSANDTYAKPNVHQGGPYIGKDLLRMAFPVLCSRADDDRNPDLQLPVRVVSHGLSQDVRLIWYNSGRLEHRGNGRDEARLTSWGGKAHPLVAEEATGSLVVFAFRQLQQSLDADACEVWITSSAAEDDAILERIGPVDPGSGVTLTRAKTSYGTTPSSASRSCALSESEMMTAWRSDLPSGEEILSMVLERQLGALSHGVDRRLMERRRCEFEIFRSIESHIVLPRVRDGFSSVDEFVVYANSVTNRRKSRAGRSLELHLRQLFQEESVPHSWGKATEDKRIPDFIFPSITSYHDERWPKERLLMLGAKTTCKDRWRQVLSEASRVDVKHLLTLQEGVSEPQFREMEQEKLRLVVPRSLHKSYPESIRPRLVTLEEFVVAAKSLVPTRGA